MKAINIVLGIATAVILGGLINLGIKAFYPEPKYPVYPPYAATTDQQATYQTAQQNYEGQMQVYDRNLFIIANVVGIIVFAIGFWLIFNGISLASNGAPVGIMLAGVWGILYGYARGWDSANDQVKFFVGLAIAAIVIGGSMWLIERHKKIQAPTQ